jgi:RNase P subunit RPR2
MKRLTCTRCQWLMAKGQPGVLALKRGNLRLEVQALATMRIQCERCAKWHRVIVTAGAPPVVVAEDEPCGG